MPESSGGITLKGISSPLLIAAGIAAAVGVLLFLILDIGTVPALAHPGLILLVTGALVAAAAMFLRSENVGAAEAVTTIGVVLLVIFGLVLMVMALAIQLDSGNINDARRSLAFLVIAPLTTGAGFALIPAVKAARVVAARAAGESTDSLATGKGEVASKLLAGAALLIATIGAIGMLLGLLDWSRGIAPTDSPYTFFAGAFAALGGVLMYLLGRAVVAAPNVPD